MLQYIQAIVYEYSIIKLTQYYNFPEACLLLL